MTEHEEVQIVINHITKLDMRAGAQLMIDVFGVLEVEKGSTKDLLMIDCRQCHRILTNSIYCISCRQIYVKAFMAIFHNMVK